MRPDLTNNLGIMACVYNPSYVGRIVMSSWYKASLGINVRPYLKNNWSKKWLRVWLKWESTCLASSRP
jgi:hypothetical protein